MPDTKVLFKRAMIALVATGALGGTGAVFAGDDISEWAEKDNDFAIELTDAQRGILNAELAPRDQMTENLTTYKDELFRLNGFDCTIDVPENRSLSQHIWDVMASNDYSKCTAVSTSQKLEVPKPK